MCLKKSPKRKKAKMGTMDKILLIVGSFILVFTIAMMVIYVVMGGIPDTLVTCVFSMCSFEGGFMALIKTTKFFKKENTEKKEEKTDTTAADSTPIEPEDPPKGREEF